MYIKSERFHHSQDFGSGNACCTDYDEVADDLISQSNNEAAAVIYRTWVVTKWHTFVFKRCLQESGIKIGLSQCPRRSGQKMLALRPSSFLRPFTP
ncbi:hypothetical protein EVAR_38355_1 [Eumeta japonica]|uniref:Uncharacterized protein n=1 Tax=Eumeta variegata TaxID=151549 RepID=A0A4C1Y037_EUMVA|nr:hypothetical protein EVAR_38355_1 [Eumeta japonica]